MQFLFFIYSFFFFFFLLLVDCEFFLSDFRIEFVLIIKFRYNILLVPPSILMIICINTQVWTTTAECDFMRPHCKRTLFSCFFTTSYHYDSLLTMVSVLLTFKKRSDPVLVIR